MELQVQYMKIPSSEHVKNMLHYVLRVLKTSLWDPRRQTYVFKTQIKTLIAISGLGSKTLKM